MDINLDCIYCTLKKSDIMFSKYENDEKKKMRFMKEVFSIIGNMEEEDTSPLLNAEIMRLLNDTLKLGDVYYEIKNEYNNLLVEMEEDILYHINSSADRLLMALKYAMVGNLIDFGAMGTVNDDQLKELIRNSSKQEIDKKVYYKFLNELKNTKKVVYITDNAGEIVFDKIFIKVIKELYPEIMISALVRGKPIYNDATLTDAESIGLSEVVNVMDNGTDIPGTQLNKISSQSKQLIDNADLIISKGQGNFESLFGCGKNIYYIFLCKCDLFVKRFNLEKYKGVFANETDIEAMIV